MGIAYQKTLFKVHSNGKVGDWVITVTDNQDGTALMERAATKVLGGKPVVTPTEYTQGKNIGRANETTALEQAVLEAEARYKKQLDKGYVVEQPEEGAAVTNSLGFVKPMLAQPIEKVKGWTYPVYASAKLDGNRMLATVKDGEVVLYSRQGKVLDIFHIKDILQRHYELGAWDGTTLDGEVYVHGKTLQEINSLIKKPKPESMTLGFFIYDCISSEPYPNRLKFIKKVTEGLDPEFVCRQPTFIFNTDEQVNEFHAKNLSQGYEGTMLRWGDFGYEDGKRSKSLMKKKDFQDAEFEIFDVSKGKPKILDGETLEQAIYHCRTKDGKEFTCTAPGTMYEKHEAWVIRESAIGRQLTVKYFNYTDDGVPFLPVALRIREDV